MFTRLISLVETQIQINFLELIHINLIFMSKIQINFLDFSRQNMEFQINLLDFFVRKQIQIYFLDFFFKIQISNQFTGFFLSKYRCKWIYLILSVITQDLNIFSGFFLSRSKFDLNKKEKIKIGPNLYYFGIFSCNFVFITDRILSRDFKMKTPIFLKLILYALLDYSMWMKTDGFILKQKSQQ